MVNREVEVTINLPSQIGRIITPTKEWVNHDFTYLIPMPFTAGYRELQSMSNGQTRILQEGRAHLVPLNIPQELVAGLDPVFAYVSSTHQELFLHGGLPNSRGRLGTLRINNIPITPSGWLLHNGDMITWGNQETPNLIGIKFNCPQLSQRIV